ADVICGVRGPTSWISKIELPLGLIMLATTSKEAQSKLRLSITVPDLPDKEVMSCPFGHLKSKGVIPGPPRAGATVPGAIASEYRNGVTLRSSMTAGMPHVSPTSVT